MSTAKKSLAAAVKVVNKLDNLPTLPYCTGTFQWNKDKSTLFYKGKSTGGFLNFPATDSQLESLSDACTAGKIVPGNFALSFSPWHEGLVGVLEGDLLKDVESKNIKVGMSRLTVYGPGGSSSTDTDVPSSVMASLTIILPTVHEGGLVILNQDGKKWTFDTSTAVSTTPSVQAAFIASYGNVKHEVEKVTSGYLVTLTYDFYFKKDIKTSPAFTPELQQYEPQLKEALDRLLKDSDFFPGGGFIGFGLSHKYPFVLESTNLSDIKKGLKGSDATIKRACEGLSLDTSIRAVYLDDDDEPPSGRGVLLDNPMNYNYQVQGYLIDHLTEWGDAVVDHKQYGTQSNPADKPIAWLRPLQETNDFTFFYIDDDYKRPSSNDVDAEICLVAKIPPASERGLAAVPDTQVVSESDQHQNKKRRHD